MKWLATNAVGVVGCGTLGSAVAHRLLDKKFPVVVWNRTPHKAHGLVERGAIPAHSVAHVVASCPVVLACLTDARAMHALFLADQDVPAGDRQAFSLLNLGTIGPAMSLWLSDRCRSLGIDYVEMPVSGGPDGARAGTLALYAGNYAVPSDRVDSVIAALSDKQVWTGSNQVAQGLKVLNNLCEAINLWGAAEALATAEAMGLDSDLIADGLTLGRGDSVYLRVLLDRLANPRPDVAVPLDVRIKDIDLALQLAGQHGGKLPVAESMRDLYAAVCRQMGGAADQSACRHYGFYRPCHAPTRPLETTRR